MPEIACPSCHASSQAPNGQALAGRRVRCPHCKTVWQMPGAARPQARPSHALVPVAPVIAEAEISAPLVPARLISRPPRRARTIIDVGPPAAARPMSRRRPAAARFDMAGLAACLLCILLLAGAVTLREPIVRLAPGLAGLYALAGLEVNLRGLTFSDLTVARDDNTGEPVLTVGGKVTNVTGSDLDIPAIRLALKTEGRHEIYSWQVEPSVTRLAPGQTFSFRSQLARPTDPATDLEVRFATRHQQVARIP